ncbi:hypothetical protein TrCOL_g1873 [Triparma columacea]|nr:hypothetical protein TrCOL_g1873 [Triparma columacea]
MHYGRGGPGVRKGKDVCKEKAGGMEGRYHDITGTVIHESYLPPQVWDMKSNRSEEYERVHKLQSVASAAVGRWGRKRSCPISYSEASWTGLFDWRRKKWAEEVARVLLPEGGTDMLPEVTDFDDTSNLVPKITEFDSTGAKNPYWDRWPELRGTKCRTFLGVGDGAAANFGSRCGGGGRVCVTVGTSAAARIVVEDEDEDGDGVEEGEGRGKVPEGMWCYRVDGKRRLVGGALTDGGSVVEWMRGILGLEDDEEFNKVMEEVSSGSGGGEGECSAVPFFSGERSTGWRGNATAAIVGITRDTKKADIVRANLEGVAMRIAKIVEPLKRLSEAGVKPGDGGGSAQPRSAPPPPTTLVACGTGLDRNRAWRQMICDASGSRVAALDEGEATSRGVAILMAERLGGGGEGRGVESLEGCEWHEVDEGRRRTFEVKMMEQERAIRALEEGVWGGGRKGGGGSGS